MESNLEEVHIRSRLYVIVDNRIIPSSDFATEAYLNAYYRGIQQLILELGSYLCKERWVTLPITLAYASSAHTTQIVHINSDNVHLLYTVLNTKHSSLGGSNAPNQTWQNYFSDALKKLIQYSISLPNYQSASEVQRTIVLFYSTQAALIGNPYSGSIQEGIKTFKTTCDQIHTLKDFIEFRLVCFGSEIAPTTPIQYVSFSNRSETNDFLMSKTLSEAVYSFRLERRLCSTAHFEEEYKVVLGLLAYKRIIKLELPSYQSLECQIYLELSPVTLCAIEMIPTIKSLEVCAISSRAGINPLHIKGNSFECSIPMNEMLKKLLQSEESVNYNRFILEALCRYLCDRHCLLILRGLTRSPSHSSQLQYSYWALIPPEHPTSVVMVLMQLVDRDDVIIPTTRVVDSNSEEEQASREIITREMSHYLDKSFQECFGIQSHYNPFLFTKGQVKFSGQNLITSHSITTTTNPYPPAAPNVVVDLIEEDSSKKCDAKAPTTTVSKASEKKPPAKPRATTTTATARQQASNKQQGSKLTLEAASVAKAVPEKKSTAPTGKSKRKYSSAFLNHLEEEMDWSYE